MKPTVLHNGLDIAPRLRYTVLVMVGPGAFAVPDPQAELQVEAAVQPKEAAPPVHELVSYEAGLFFGIISSQGGPALIAVTCGRLILVVRNSVGDPNRVLARTDWRHSQRLTA